MNLTDLRALVDKQKSLREFLRREMAETAFVLEGLQEDRQEYLLVKDFVSRVASELRAKVKGVIESLVTRSIVTIFPELSDSKFVLEAKEDKNEVHFFLLSKNGDAMPILDFVGEGLTDVISFSLRICLLLLTKRRRVLVLDEPFRFLDRRRHGRAGDLITSLSKELGIQFIIVSHSETLIQGGDKVFAVQNTSGVSTVS